MFTSVSLSTYEFMCITVYVYININWIYSVIIVTTFILSYQKPTVKSNFHPASNTPTITSEYIHFHVELKLLFILSYHFARISSYCACVVSFIPFKTKILLTD